VHKIPVIKGNELVRFLESIGFVISRTKGSHVRMHSKDGRVTTVPIHKGKDIPKGLLRKIINEDLKMEMDAFSESYFKNK